MAFLTPAAALGAGTGVGSGTAARIAPDRIEIRLAPPAARTARLRPGVDVASGQRLRHERLGVPALDALAARSPGLTFEREFRGERPPAEGSGETDFTAFYRVRLPAGLGVDQALAWFRSRPEIVSADPIPILRASAVPNDSLWSVSSWFYQPSRFDVHAPEAWDVTTGDTSVVVAILDTGVLPYHPDLQTQIFTNPDEAAGAPDVDDDGNGYVDDLHGWDFVDLVAGDQVTPGEDWDGEDADPNDFSGHGTKVAGIAAAATNNLIGVAGTAWHVRLMPLRVMWSEPGATNGVVDMSYVAEALLYAARMGAAVANCSFETANLGGLQAAASAAIRAGVTIVCPAGNGGTTFHALADREDVLAIGATAADDVVAAYSNTGAYVDLVAPGSGVASTYVMHAGPDSVSQRQPDYNAALNGTSFSAPFASGAVALVQSHRRELGLPPLPPLDMVFRLRETADDIAAQNPGGADYGTGRLNLFRALTEPDEWISTAFRTGARHVGPAVVIPRQSGTSRLAFSTLNARLVIVDFPGADTIANVALGSRHARQIAAAELGPGLPIGIFGGTLDGRVTGHGTGGSVLPGWPVTAVSGIAMSGGPALADLDGDGTVEIVCGSDDGSLFAWHGDGTPLTNFPAAPFTSGFSGAVALADVDGQPGAEIVGLSRSSELTVLGSGGNALTGWPQTITGTTTTISPVVARFSEGGEPAIIVPIPGGVRAYRASGAVRFSVTGLGGNVVFDPALADLDGDAHDEIVLTLSNATAVALDSTGAMIPGWPVALGGASQGPVVVGPLGAGGAPGVLAFRAGSLLAWDGAGQRITTFPRPGAAGAFPTIAELDGDGRSEVVAETGPDSLFYVYDAGASTWSASGPAWRTPRGNMARTGAHEGPALAVLDDVPPAAIANFTAESLKVDRAYLMWTAPGDDGGSGTAARYEIHVTTVAAEAGTFAGGTIVVPPAPPDPAGSWQVYTLTGLTTGVTYYLAIRAVDEAGNVGSASNVVVATPTGGPPPPEAPISGAIRPRTQPSRLPVDLVWQGARGTDAGTHVIRIYDLSGRQVRTLSAGAGAGGTVQWDGQMDDSRAARPGLYFARLESGGQRTETRIVLIP